MHIVDCVDEIYVKLPRISTQKYEYIHVLQQSIGAERECLRVIEETATLNTALKQECKIDSERERYKLSEH